jgi:hypothetical protein
VRALSSLLTQITAGQPLPSLERVKLDGSVLDASGVSAVSETLEFAAGDIAVNGNRSTHLLTIDTADDAEIELPSPLIPGVRHLFVINVSGVTSGEVEWSDAYNDEDAPNLEGLLDGATVVVEYEVNAAGTGLQMISAAESVTGGLTLLTATITNAQALALPTTPVAPLFTGPGNGFRWSIVDWQFMLSPWVADLTNVDATATLRLVSGPQETEIEGATDILTDGEAAGGVGRGGSGVGKLTDFSGHNIDLEATNGALGDFTGGNVGNGYTVRALVRAVPVP